MVTNSKEDARRYYEAYKARTNERVKCDICNKMVVKRCFPKHCKGKKHLRLADPERNKEIQQLKDRLKELTGK
jgi:hypothetical protein